MITNLPFFLNMPRPDYVKDGLMLNLLGVKNTREGFDPEALYWEDLSGNNRDFNLGSTATESGKWTTSPNGCYFTTSSLGGKGNSMNYSYVTVEVIFSLDSSSGTKNIICNYQSGGYGIETNSSNGKYATVFIAGTWRNLYLPEGSIADNVVYKLSCTYDGTIFIGYRDGSEIGRLLIAGTVKPPEQSTVMAIGYNPVGTSHANANFNGTVYASRIYNRALSAEEIRHNHVTDQKIFSKIL